MTSTDSGRPGPAPAPADPSADPSAGPLADHAADSPDVGRATGTLMALLPCDSRGARRVLAEAAALAGLTLAETALAVTAVLRDDAPRPPAVVESAVRTAIDRALTAARAPSAVLLPNPYVLHRHLARFRDLRRRTFANADDPGLRARYDDAAYTLCVLLGHRSVHHALTAAEHLIAAHRLTGPAPAARPDS
ncbi:DUF5133 domain-containing protein [Streptomyces subrutilus]|nr:DUF5133 domain-containing protein [Streptomyces subrutilus]